MNDFGNYQYCQGIYGINITLGAGLIMYEWQKNKQKQDKNKKFPLALMYQVSH